MVVSDTLVKIASISPPIARHPTNTTPPPTTTPSMSANFNPYVQGWRAGNAPSTGGPWGTPSGESPSIFGALPGGGQSGQGQRSQPAPGSVMFYITNYPHVLNTSVIDARGRQCYKIVSEDPMQPNQTAFYDVHRRTVALIDWGSSRPTVEMPGLLPRQPVRNWLQTASDRASRMMDIRGVPYVWIPDGEYICLFYGQRANSERLGRICVIRDTVQIELSQQAVDGHLTEACILSASIFLSNRNID